MYTVYALDYDRVVCGLLFSLSFSDNASDLCRLCFCLSHTSHYINTTRKSLVLELTVERVFTCYITDRLLPLMSQSLQQQHTAQRQRSGM
jgi:hypothetical protein